MFLKLIEAILESLELTTTEKKTRETEEILKEFEDGSHLMVLNCYPPCPQPELTFGMPPHSDYGFVTLVLQDEVEGLQIMSENRWHTVQPVPNSFVVNVGDHLEVNDMFMQVTSLLLIWIYNPIKSSKEWVP